MIELGKVVIVLKLRMIVLLLEIFKYEIIFTQYSVANDLKDTRNLKEFFYLIMIFLL